MIIFLYFLPGDIHIGPFPGEDLPTLVFGSYRFHGCIDQDDIVVDFASGW